MKSEEIVGIFITMQKMGNMDIHHIQVTDYAIQQILKTVQLLPSVQEEVVDKLVDRTPHWMDLSPEDQLNKMKVVLAQETVIEYLRLHHYIKNEVEMIEVSIDQEGSMLISVFYIEKTKELQQIFQDQLSEDEVNEMERQLNILDGSINIYEEAKKRMELAGKNNVVPFQNRAARRKQKIKR